MRIAISQENLDMLLRQLVGVSEEPVHIEITLRVAHGVVELYLQKHRHIFDARIFVQRDNATGALHVIAFRGEEDDEERAYLAREGN